MYLKLKNGIAGKANGISLKDTLLQPKGPFKTITFLKSFIYKMTDKEIEFLKANNMIDKFDIVSASDYEAYRKKFAESLEANKAEDTLSPEFMDDRIYTPAEAEKLLKAEQIALLTKRKVTKEDMGGTWGKEQNRIDMILKTNPKVGD